MVVVVVVAAKYITPCKKDDPKLNECAVKAGRAAIPHFINGERVREELRPQPAGAGLKTASVRHSTSKRRVVESVSNVKTSPNSTLF